MHHNNMAGANYDPSKGQSASLVHVINTNTFSHTVSSAWSEIVHWSFIWAGIGSQIEITFFLSDAFGANFIAWYIDNVWPHVSVSTPFGYNVLIPPGLFLQAAA